VVSLERSFSGLKPSREKPRERGCESRYFTIINPA
jgi:hypothetical protein